MLANMAYKKSALRTTVEDKSNIAIGFVTPEQQQDNSWCMPFSMSAGMLQLIEDLIWTCCQLKLQQW